MAGIDLGTLIVAIVAAVIALNIPAIYRSFKDHQRSKRECLKLTWDDISDYNNVLNPAAPRSLHPCSYLHGSQSYHKSQHTAGPACWETDCSLAGVFPQGWKLDKSVKNGIRVPVPQCFPADVACIATDVRTLLAFVILTAPDVVGARNAWSPKKGSYGSTSIKVTRLNETATVHVRGSFMPSRQSLTKTDISRMLDGFPPWYRESVRNTHNIWFPFPIKDVRDVPRGGWVLAVGFTDTKKPTQRPVPVYRPIDEPDESEFRAHGVVYRAAVSRCRDHIEQNIAPLFLNNVTVRRALESLNYLVKNNTNSFMPHLESFFQVPMDQVTGSQLRFATKLFNKFKPLKDDEVAALQPIIDQVLAACVLGAEEIIRYLKDDGVELKVPEGLGWLDDVVYLRDCSTEWKV